MSGAHHSFRGLESPPKNKHLAGVPYLGDPCLHRYHSRPYGDTQAWRDGHTHACLACAEQVQQGHLSFDADRLRQDIQGQVMQFWSRVDITDLDSCWRWTDVSKKSRLFFYWRRPSIRSIWRFHPIQVATWLTWGDLAREGFVSLCGERRCVNPLHNLPLSLTADFTLNSDQRHRLSLELEELKSKVSSFCQSKSIDRLSILPEVDTEHISSVLNSGHSLSVDTCHTPFELLFQQAQKSIQDGTHVTQLAIT